MEDLEQGVSLHVKSDQRLLWVSSHEEDRSESRISAVAQGLGLYAFRWDCRGFAQLSSASIRQPGNGQCPSLPEALNAVRDYSSGKAVFAFHDFAATIERIERSPECVLLFRQVKELPAALRRNGNVVIFLAPSPRIPPELEEYVSLVEAALPDHEERLRIMLAWISANCRQMPSSINEEVLHRAAAVSAGMTSHQLQVGLASSVVKRRGLIPAVVTDLTAQKVMVVKKTELLECIETGEKLENVGGLECAKSYLRKRKLAFCRAAKCYGLPTPKGIVLVGPPGVGKSLLAKAVADVMGLPLVRFDMGRIHGSLVGQSEERMRRALSLIDNMSPVICWVDEIEKAFAGASGPSGDSGVGQRVFGTFLSWSSERSTPVFIVATANAISQLPPEFLRKGRFDEIFFVDLPTPEERATILDVLLRKRGQNSQGLITASLIAKTERFAGAELEQAIVDALFDSFSDNQRPLTAADLEAAASRTVPVADSMRSEIEELRRWGRANARPASGTH
jgi:SpoVK/Ycf46/Vps4 family AAA+-type ATPase